MCGPALRDDDALFHGHVSLRLQSNPLVTPSPASLGFAEWGAFAHVIPEPDNVIPTTAKSESPAEATAVADLACVRLAQEGDRGALDELVRRHHPAVARLLWRFVRRREDLDDLVQETFLRMVRGLPGWRADQPFVHWLLRIATNVGRDFFRRAAVRKRWMAQSASDSVEASVIPEPIEPGADPAARLAADEVKAMLERLPPDDRTLLTLHHLEGWELSRIAAQFGWTVTAAKLRAWRARRRLRSLYESHPS